MTKKFVILVVVFSALLGGFLGAVGGVVTSTVARDPILRLVAQMWPGVVTESVPAAATNPVMGSEPTEPILPSAPAALTPDEETQVADVVEGALPSVVSIVGSEKRSVSSVQVETDGGTGLQITPIEPHRDVQTGSGFVVADGKYIITNRHVVNKADLDYTVVTYNSDRLAAEVIARDPFADIAILRLKGKTTLKALPIGNSDTLRIGQTVIVIGNSLSQYRNSVTKGVISGFGRRIVAGDGSESEVIEGAIQTDAAINVGNSGGPLLNLRGEVIGINTAINREGQSLGFSIPAREVRRVIESVRKYGRIIRPWLGVRYVTLSERLAQTEGLSVSQGALVIESDEAGSTAVIAGGPADKAGIRSRDIITHVNSTALNETNPLGAVIGRSAVGQTVKLKIIRDGKTITIPVLLEEYKAE